MRAPGGRGVVGGAGRDEDGAEVLVAEVELDLLVRALDEERRIRVRDRAVALQRETGRDADHQLLADADVEDPLVPGEVTGADVREHHRDLGSSSSTRGTRS